MLYNRGNICECKPVSQTQMLFCMKNNANVQRKRECVCV